ncbi:hypothetical protein [Inquilinus sp. CA228]|uniref:hypothetical protein n=1 Tax=Inquilinus sp. CA228 TaxID=3455609 RepID=UPI003F8D05BE
MISTVSASGTPDQQVSSVSLTARRAIKNIDHFLGPYFQFLVCNSIKIKEKPPGQSGGPLVDA